MKNLYISIFITLFLLSSWSYGQQVIVNINTLAPKKPVSPFLYGKNNSLSDNPSDPLTAAEWQRLRDMGIRMFRENGGNNATKYNWRRKLSSHPDWYNNVYTHNWDFTAASLGTNIPTAQGMWAFQLIGKAARTGSANFNDWGYNRSNWWPGVSQNLCGGGTLNPDSGGHALVEGNPSLYLENWNADSTTGILDHWFGSGGIGLTADKILYWSMDNEPEIWNGTHDDVWPSQPSAEEFMQMYFATAKKARTKFPGIKLVGPVPANEWQWYNWDGGSISYNGKNYVWLEYFILRIAEEQQASGMRLLDVLDIHFYPGEKGSSDITQLHRVFFDTTYNYPGANGVRRLGQSGWDNTLTKEYILKRCSDWLMQYMGPGHGVTFSVTETAIAKKDDPNLTAIWYASTLGEFARQGVEIFTPWDWITGMSEVVHLFSRYGHKNILPAQSSDEYYVSAYPTINSTGDSMTIFLVNRHLSESREIQIKLNGFFIKDGVYKLYTLSNLPSSETFVSRASNALSSSDIQVTGNVINLSLDPLSVSAFVVKNNTTVYNKYGELVSSAESENGTLNGVTTSSALPGYSGAGYVTGFDSSGDRITMNLNVPTKAVYRIVIRYAATGQSEQNLTVNGSFTAKLAFAPTTSFTRADAGGFVLNAGTNSIVLSHFSGSVHPDRIEVYLMEKNDFTIAPELIDTSATTATRDLYNFLQYQFGERIISGQTHDYYNQLKTIAGKSPMLRAGDFQHFTQGYPYLWVNGIGHTYGYDGSDGTVNSLISWYNSTGKKGIVSIHWHWHDPLGDSTSNVSTNTFYTDYSDFDIRRAVIPGTLEYNCVIRDIDSVAFQLKKFQQAGIPILWRPLHEAGGGWFWWGAHGAESCLALWDILLERLKNYHQLHNLIWVWSSPEPEWYPGNDKVDMIGYDSYPGDFNYTNQKAMFDNLYMITRGEKLIAMTENGPIPDPDACLSQDAPWLYFMSWSNLVASQNSTAHITDVFNNPVVLTLESTNAKTGFEWRSSLYPEDWQPGYKDQEGRFLHDFSYAGYQRGESPVPIRNNNIIDVSLPPYNADATGITDATAPIQKALDDAGEAGGGVVYLPPGTYRIAAADTSDAALVIRYDSTVLRGAGQEMTFLLNTATVMRNKEIIRLDNGQSGWFSPVGEAAIISFDLNEPTRYIPVQSVSGLKKGDPVVVTSTPTDAFIEEHGMTGYWTAQAIKGVAFKRRITSIDTINNLIIIDAPTRYPLKKRDQARVYRINEPLGECGIENLSIGNLQNPNNGWGEEDYSIPGTGAYEVHASHAVHFKNAENCWVKNVGTFKTVENSGDYHLLSNGVKLNQSRFISIDSCNFEKPQYEGGGGNGYMYTLESNDCLVKNSRANDGRHNYSFKYPYSNGNVILKSRGENSRYASDFHMYLSMSNLFDACTFNGDYLESAFRPYGGDAIHGYTSSQSVFYNTTGENYHPDRDYLIDSRQTGWGYVIGTGGDAFEVSLDPAYGTINGFVYNTLPRDFTEGIGEAEWLLPRSLYLDQLSRRMNDTTGQLAFTVEIIIKDADTHDILPGSFVQVYNDTAHTGTGGSVLFHYVPGFFTVSVTNSFCEPLRNRQYLIHSDTSLTIYLTRNQFDVTVRVLRNLTFEPLSMNSVLFSGETQVTNESGEVYFTVYGGEHSYSVQRTSYEGIEGIIEVSSDTIMVLYLLQTHANLRIRLREGTKPVNNAIVIVENDTLTSNSLGDALYNKLPVSVTYDYTVRKNGYGEITGSVYLSEDTIVLIEMAKVPVSVDFENEEGIFSIWPNPVEDFLNISLPEQSGLLAFQITNVNGVIVSTKVSDLDRVRIDVREMVSGVYILRVIAGKDVYKKYFIKK